MEYRLQPRFEVSQTSRHATAGVLNVPQWDTAPVRGHSVGAAIACLPLDPVLQVDHRRARLLFSSYP
jgi:hypothetical protein